MTVESLLKVISERMNVDIKDRYGNTLIRFKFGEDIEVFSPSFLFHKIAKIEIEGKYDLKIYLEDTKND